MAKTDVARIAEQEICRFLEGGEASITPRELLDRVISKATPEQLEQHQRIGLDAWMESELRKQTRARLKSCGTLGMFPELPRMILLGGIYYNGLTCTAEVLRAHIEHCEENARACAERAKKKREQLGALADFMDEHKVETTGEAIALMEARAAA